MEINKRDNDYNPWAGQTFIIAHRVCKTKDDTPVNPEAYNQEGEPFQVENATQFQLKLAELAPKNSIMKELAVKEGREMYTQKFIMKL